MSSRVWPVGAVSMTTNCRRAWWTRCENCPKTATSSVHGDSKSSASRARPASSKLAPLVARTLSRYAAVATLGSMRDTVKPAPRPASAGCRPDGSALPSASSRWPAGSVVVRWTVWPRSASATAMAAATVVLPTPPLPMHITSPWSWRASSSTSAANRGSSRRAAGDAEVEPGESDVWPSANTRLTASTPMIVSARNGTWVHGIPARAGGRAARARASRCRIACASRSPEWSGGSTPLRTRCWSTMPSCASSLAVRAASASDELCGRATRTSRVHPGSARRASAVA